MKARHRTARGPLRAMTGLRHRIGFGASASARPQKGAGSLPSRIHDAAPRSGKIYQIKPPAAATRIGLGLISAPGRADPIGSYGLIAIADHRDHDDRRRFLWLLLATVSLRARTITMVVAIFRPWPCSDERVRVTAGCSNSVNRPPPEPSANPASAPRKFSGRKPRRR